MCYTAQSPELQRKMQETSLKRYGKKNYTETKEFKDKSIDTCNKKYGVDYPCQFPQCIESLENAVGHSKPEQEFAKILDDNGINYEREYPLRGFKYDFKVDNILFEINPTSTHNSAVGLFNKEPKKPNYHFIKHIVAKDFGYHCVHIFDWDDSEKIVKLFLTEKERIFARNCTIKEVSKELAVEFINKNHLQGYATDEIRIGLFENDTDELVEIMTFAKPRYNKNFEYELVRLCSSKNVVGGFEKIFKHFVNEYKPNSVISYCDLSKFDGNVYYKLVFSAKKGVKPSKHWHNYENGRHITDNLLRQRGFGQLFNTNYGKGTSNEELMINNGFLPVYDCGQLTFYLYL